MLREWRVEEVRQLLPSLSTTAASAIGYKELAAYLRGECSLDTAAEEIKKATRNYAKRQLTWLRRSEGEQHLLSIDQKSTEDLSNEVKALILPFLQVE